VREAVIVVGYRAAEVRERIGERVGPMRISYRENAGFATSNTTRSLHDGVDGVDRDILILEGDVFFDQRLIDHFLALRIPDGTAVERWRPGLDGSMVTVAPDGRVNAWIHKKDRPAGFRLDGTFKTVNVHRFSKDFVRTWLRPALAAQVARDGGGEPIETVFADIVKNGGWVHAVEVRGSWIEIDDESDLHAAEALFRGPSHGSR
jgi:NDP-sugar pyrophosphorylase family protein